MNSKMSERLTDTSSSRTAIRSLTGSCTLALFMSACALLNVSACGKKPVASVPPVPPNFSQALLYAQKAALAYEPDATIQQPGPAGGRITVSSPVSSGMKAYVEVNDAMRVQWVVVRGTSNLINIRSDVDYNKVAESRLQIPLHKGFADAAMQVYQFAKPLLKSNYETRVTGHSYGGAAAAIVLMLLKEDGFKLGQAMTFGQPKVTNRDGVRKYGSLPLLRFINDKDPVPLLPPFELFAVLDEGPYQHLGPEVVLEEGTKYRYYADHQAETTSVLSFWNNLKDFSLQDIPDHAIAAYVGRIRQKVPAGAQTDQPSVLRANETDTNSSGMF